MSQIVLIALVTASSVSAIGVRELEGEEELAFLAEHYHDEDKVRRLVAKGHLLCVAETPEESAAVSERPNVIHCDLERLADRMFGSPTAAYLYDASGTQMPAKLASRSKQYNKCQMHGRWYEYRNHEQFFGDTMSRNAA